MWFGMSLLLFVPREFSWPAITRWISVVERDSGDLSLAPTGMDERTEKPKRWVGQRGGEHSVFFISFLRKAPIGLFRGAYRF